MIDVRKYKDNEKPSNIFLKWMLIAGGIFILCSIIGRIFSEFFNYIEVREIGEKFVDIFLKNLMYEVLIEVSVFIFLFSTLSLSLLVLRKNLKELSLNSGIFSQKKFLFVFCFIAALLFSSAISENMYEKLLLFINGGEFSNVDPIFGKNIGYYVFKRPFLILVWSAVYDICFIQMIFIYVMYFVFACVVGGHKIRDIIRFKNIGKHAFFYVFLILILKVISYIFKAEDLLFGSFGELNGAGSTDINIWLNYYHIAPFVLMLVILFCLYFLRKEKYTIAFRTFLFYPAVWVLTFAISIAFQYVFVSPNEVVRESKYINNNIVYTKEAYNINNIKEVEFNVENNLTSDDLVNYKNTLDNVRILDLESNLTVLNQIQGIRNYYKFNETDIIPFVVNKEKTAVAITAREITKENLSDTADTYINRKLRYTHGFGVAVNPINTVSSHGQPEFLVKDIPPKSVEGFEKITQPRIYFGELTNDYVIVGSNKYKELDYSEGQEDIEFTYDGRAGINLSVFNRAMFAAKYGDFRLLVSDMFTKDSKILINRNIIERLKKAIPFLKYDSDPYIIIDGEGRLKWIVDAYTETSYYPYSQSIGHKNYIRNSVKAVIDAYDGDIKLYISDEEDPIINAYNSMYPGVFEIEELPEDIKEHIKYPEYLFKVQSEVYAKYHINNPTAFYNKNDLWVVANEKYGSANEERTVTPYYNLMRLNGEVNDELLLTIPYTLANKDNMVSWLAVRNDWDRYGELYVYKFQKDINIYGPMQIENRINSDTEISSALTLWSQGGSKVIRGNILIVPVKNSIIYIEPLYMTSNNQSTLPELKQVIVAYDEKIVMKNNLSDALYALFGEIAPSPSDVVEVLPEEEIVIGEVTYEEAVKAVIDSFSSVKESSANGDWEKFGIYMNELEKAVDELKKQN